jgi:two-component system nitrogen regulation response regulator GlnG
MAKTVLLVEDDSYTRKYIQLMLQDKGFDVVSCDTIFKARQILENIKVHFAVVDGLLPDGNGIVLAENLDCPILFCSGVADEYNRKSMWQLGTVYPKPVDASFNDCVDRVMKNGQR